MKTNPFLPLTLTFPLLLAACSGVNVWPFDSAKPGGSSGPANATAYSCDAGKRFHVRLMDNGATAWLILPDREVRLEKSVGGNVYSNGITTLDLSGSEALLKDSGKTTHSGCKTGAKAN
jgi:membrane-bound inhibitor of C-type lysozyme